MVTFAELGAGELPVEHMAVRRVSLARIREGRTGTDGQSERGADRDAEDSTPGGTPRFRFADWVRVASNFRAIGHLSSVGWSAERIAPPVLGIVNP